jgi:hypothetical protein
MSYLRISILSLIVLATLTQAQPISQIKIGVNGLTCSACTRSVEMSLLRLNFVDSVAMSLENTEGIIYTKELMPLDFNKVAKAVTDAGFSVRFLEANITLDNSSINENGCFTLAGINFQWLGYNKTESTNRFTFIDSPFLPGKEYARWKKKIKNDSCFPGQAFHVVNAD